MKKVFLLLLLFITHNPVLLWAASDDYPVVSTPFQQQRSTSEDIIIFRNKDTLRGQVVNEFISMTTQYGIIHVPVRMCAGISYAVPQSNTDSIVTVNFNRFTGIITDDSLKIKQDTSGTVIPVRKEKIRYALFKQDKKEAELHSNYPESDLFVMSNGDLLSGESVERKIIVTANNTSTPVNLSEIKNIKIQNDSNLTSVITKTNGEIVEGTLDTDEMSIDLMVGPRINAVYKDKFSWILVGQAQKQSPVRFDLEAPKGGNPDSDAYTETGASLEQILNVNLEPSLGKRGTHMKLVLIPAGTFVMGSGASEKERNDDEVPVREITISSNYHMGIHEVTQEQFVAVMGFNPGKFREFNNPVEQVSWEQAILFCKKMSKVIGMDVTLPTEAEWEYAARAGSQTLYYFGDNESELDTHAWYGNNSEEKTHLVGQKAPNNFGLYDMYGNVYEWCIDWYQGNYTDLAVKDPLGPKSGNLRVIRGGGWNSDVQICRSARRSFATPDLRNSNLGFRVIIIPEGSSRND